MKFLKIPAGNYRIGTSKAGVEKCVADWRNRLINPSYEVEEFQSWIEKEYPDHVVETAEFEMSQALVTNAQVKLFIESASAEVPESIAIEEGPDHPVWGVSHSWALEFAEWMSAQSVEFNYRLPTETEWEIAARGTDFREYPYGDVFDARSANTVESGHGRTTPVLAHAHGAGPFGHCDLAGNVEEWVGTHCYTYPGGTLIEDGLYRRLGNAYFVLRGGSFLCGGDLGRGARRHGPFPDPKFRYTGFRLVRVGL